MHIVRVGLRLGLGTGEVGGVQVLPCKSHSRARSRYQQPMTSAMSGLEGDCIHPGPSVSGLMAAAGILSKSDLTNEGHTGRLRRSCSTSVFYALGICT